MLRRLSQLLQPKPTFPAPTPDAPLALIGDVHGRADLLGRAFEQFQDFPTVCVGDYVDRGDHSAEVLQMMAARPDVTCLMGNHEQMMLDFLDNPTRAGSRWLRYGGLQTLASFGLHGVTESSDSGRLEQARDALVAAMGTDLIAWMRALPSLWQSGNVAVVHAAADPRESIANQTDQHLLWGHPAFERTPRQDGVWVVHGHTIVDAPYARNGRIAIDTGAYATGRLTVAVIDLEGVTFHQVT